MTTPAGINEEMRPYLRMTLPRGMERIDSTEIEIGKPVGRSWILLFGLIHESGCEVTDRVRWEPRFGFLASPLRPVFAWFFRHRHKRLVRHFGSC